MKKFGFLLLCIPILFIASCSEGNDPIEEIAELKKATVEEGISNPVSMDLNVAPWIIPGENNGGNRTCEEVGEAFDVTFDMCGEKIDYDEGFKGSFPDGLNVTTDGTYVAFNIEGNIIVDGECYKVGAVIVKGSNAANVYYYPDGAMSDSGLASPLNKNGKPAGLSNLTFCFVKCECEGIAVKLWYYMKGDEATQYHAFSDGEIVFEDGWCSQLGFNMAYMEESVMLKKDGVEVGHVNIAIVAGEYVFEVHMNEGLVFDWGGYYIGSKQYLIDSTVGECPRYWEDPWVLF